MNTHSSKHDLHFEAHTLQAYIWRFPVKKFCGEYGTCLCRHTLLYSVVICHVMHWDAGVLLNYVGYPRWFWCGCGGQRFHVTVYRLIMCRHACYCWRNARVFELSKGPSARRTCVTAVRWIWGTRQDRKMFAGPIANDTYISYLNIIKTIPCLH